MSTEICSSMIATTSEVDRLLAQRIAEEEQPVVGENDIPF